jgi:hypothetical protein
MRFVLPHVRPGLYTTGFWCVPCAPPEGSTFTSEYPGFTNGAIAGHPYSKVLRVLRPNAGPGSATPRVAVAAAVVALIASAVTVAILRRHRDTA